MHSSARIAPALQAAEPALRPAGEVRFPEVDGRRSTTATCRRIVADAARTTDPELAERIESCERWRSEYATFIRELTTLAADPRRAVAIADAGLDSMRRRLVVEGDGGSETLSGALDGAPASPTRGTGEIRGSGTSPERLEVPYLGRMLHGAPLHEQLDRWMRAGTVEPSFAQAIRVVAEHPEWLSLPGRTVALVGAGSEIGPLEPLCAWGADVLAIDVHDGDLWARIGEIARRGSGTVRLPISSDGSPGLDVIAELAETCAWLEANLAGSVPVLGMYAYADGGAHVLLSGAFDALACELTSRLGTVALAYLATPTDAYLVPDAAVERAQAAYHARRARRLLQAPLKLLSRGRLYRPAYARGVPVADALVEQQGPNYAVAKRLQRWRGLLAAAAGEQVSFNVAPATWTRSVTRNRVLAAAYAGAGRFGIEVFEPATTRVLMAAMLVHDLHREPPTGPPGELMFSDGAAHGGLWTAAYEPRSVLGIAALVGLPAIALGGGRGAGAGAGGDARGGR
jgi:hypothetical protein